MAVLVVSLGGHAVISANSVSPAKYWSSEWVLDAAGFPRLERRYPV